MTNPLYDVPGLGGFLAAQDRRRAMGQQNMEGNIQQMKLADLFNASKAKMDMQKELGSLTPEQLNDPATLQRLRMKYAPDEALKYREPPKVDIPDLVKLQNWEQEFRKRGNTVQADQIAGQIKKLNYVAETSKPKWNVAERYNEQTGMPEKVLINENDPTQIQPFGGQKSQSASDSVSPYYAPVQSAGGVYVLNSRTGKMELAKDHNTGRPIVGSASDPSLQGQIAGAKESGQAKAKRAMNMAGLGDTIDQARALLSGSSGKALPTGSGMGSAYDTVAGVFGKSPEGAAEADSLRALGGALTSKMPRMEGPQSDRDTQLYKEMAGVVGNANIPRDRRLAALKTVEDLWGKYADSLTQQPANPPPSAPKTAKDYQAIAWAKAHPNDPRSAAILKTNGL